MRIGGILVLLKNDFIAIIYLGVYNIGESWINPNSEPIMEVR